MIEKIFAQIQTINVIIVDSDKELEYTVHIQKINEFIFNINAKIFNMQNTFEKFYNTVFNLILECSAI